MATSVKISARIALECSSYADLWLFRTIFDSFTKNFSCQTSVCFDQRGGCKLSGSMSLPWTNWLLLVQWHSNCYPIAIWGVWRKLKCGWGIPTLPSLGFLWSRNKRASRCILRGKSSRNRTTEQLCGRISSSLEVDCLARKAKIPQWMPSEIRAVQSTDVPLVSPKSHLW